MDAGTVAGYAVVLLALAVLCETIVDILKGRIQGIHNSVASFLWPLLAMAWGSPWPSGPGGVSPILPMIDSCAVWADAYLRPADRRWSLDEYTTGSTA